MGGLIRSKDWSDTSLGPIDHWPQSLKTTVQIMLTSRYAMWMAWGPDLTFLCNDAYRPTLGVKQSWALGSRADEVWSEIWSEIGPRIRSVLETGNATWDEGLLLFLHRSGYPEETYHTFSYSPLPDDRGRVDGMLCVVTEETERLIGERRLATLRDLAAELAGTQDEEGAASAIVRGLERNARDLPFALVYLFDPSGDQARLLLSVGLAAGEPGAVPAFPVQGDSPWPAEEMRTRLQPILVHDLAARFGDVPSGAWDTPARDAVLMPILRQGQDRPAGFLVVGLNPYRRYDAGYAGFVDLLAGQIAAGLANAWAYEEERQRAEALAEIDRAKTQFFSNISHEFRTPLTLMLGPLEEVMALPPDALRDLDRLKIGIAHRNGLRLLKLVNSLLDFSRIEAGRMKAQFEATDLAAFTAELAANFQSAMERAGLGFVIDCPSLPHPVFIDRDMWEKVVLNLLSNAFKFTFEGEVAIRIRPNAAGDGVELAVADTGAGIPDMELPRLFDRFHRVEGVRGRSFEGTGIGLALVQELVKLHGGAVTVESELGKGSVFTVALPYGSPEQSSAQARSGADAAIGTRAQAYVQEALRWLPEASGPPGDTPSVSEADDVFAGDAARGNGERILLADDNADMRAYIRRLLVAEGYIVEAVEHGGAALAAARRAPPDIVISDVMMPELDGFGLIAALRADAGLREIPVILLSARAGEEATVEGLEVGADDYLTKPFAARELLARVGANLMNARSRRETERSLREDARMLEILNRVGIGVAAELDLERAVQMVTDAATELSGAAFGAFFYNAIDDNGESYTLYTLSGASRDAFSKFPMPRNTEVFGPTFRGDGPVRSDDITQDPRYGRNAPYAGMPEGHLKVCSYLAVPVVSRSGEVIGGLFFGHPEPGIFTERSEQLVLGIAAQAAIAIDNARLYRAAQREIAERRRTEAALRESEARFRHLADNAPVMSWLTDEDGRCTYLSRSWYEFSGQTEEEALGFGWLNPVHPEDRPLVEAAFRAAHEEQHAVRIEYRILRYDGAVRWVIDTGIPRSRGHRFLGYVGCVFDITERKLAEVEREELVRQLHDLADTLEQRVQERTRELAAANMELRTQIEERERAEEALRQAQKMETIGQLTGGVAHDFNNLLTIIMGNLERLQRRLREGSDPTALHRAAENAIRGAERAAALTRSLLAFSRRQPLSPKPVDVNRLVTTMSDLLRRTLGEQIIIETVFAGGLWRTYADPNQLENALLNLALNARDAMPDGGKLTIETANGHLDEIYVSRHAEVAPGQYVVICVTDTGAGMTREVLAQAFDPFFTTKDVGHGTGLGLSQVYGFVKQSGGHVKIYSELGEGTTVKIYLPRLLSEEDAAEVQVAAVEVPGSVRAETILVVEDDPGVREHSVEMLRELGYRVLSAASGEEALIVLDRHPEIAMLFTDVGLPGGMNGRQLSEAALRVRPDLAVLFTTGYARNAIVHDGRLDPGVQLITKPFTYGELALRLRDILDGFTAIPRILVAEESAGQRAVFVELLERNGFKVVQALSGLEAINHMRLTAGRIEAAVVSVDLSDRRGDSVAAELRAMRVELPIVIICGSQEDALRGRFGGDPALVILRRTDAGPDLVETLAALGVRAPLDAARPATS